MTEFKTDDFKTDNETSEQRNARLPDAGDEEKQRAFESGIGNLHFGKSGKTAGQ